MEGIDNFQNYTTYARYMNKIVDIWGQALTVFYPKNKKLIGYEDEDLSETGKHLEPNVPNMSNLYERELHRGYLDFNPKRGVFYHFNYFPESSEELTLGYFSTEANRIREGCFIRTMTIENVSIWGDMIFKVVKIEEDGKFRLLKRTYFLRPVSSQKLHELLVPLSGVV